MTPDFVVFDEHGFVLPSDRTHLMPKPTKESTLPNGTKVSEFPGGSVLIQTPFRKDGWLSQALGECDV